LYFGWFQQGASHNAMRMPTFSGHLQLHYNRAGGGRYLAIIVQFLQSLYRNFSKKFKFRQFLTEKNMFRHVFFSKIFKKFKIFCKNIKIYENFYRKTCFLAQNWKVPVLGTCCYAPLVKEGEKDRFFV
jgi:hypothetical protein